MLTFYFNLAVLRTKRSFRMIRSLYMPYRLCNFYQSMKMKSQHKAFFQRVITFCDILKISSRAEFHPISMKIGNDLQKSVNPITGLLLLSSYYIMLPGGSSPSLVSLATTVDALSTPFLSSVTMKSGFKMFV